MDPDDLDKKKLLGKMWQLVLDPHDRYQCQLHEHDNGISWKLETKEDVSYWECIIKAWIDSFDAGLLERESKFPRQARISLYNGASMDSLKLLYNLYGFQITENSVIPKDHEYDDVIWISWLE